MISNENIHEGDCSVVLCASAPAIRPCASSPAIARLANSTPVEPTALAGDDTQGLIAGTEAHSTALAAAFVNIFIRYHQASILRVNSIFYPMPVSCCNPLSRSSQ